MQKLTLLLLFFPYNCRGEKEKSMQKHLSLGCTLGLSRESQ